MVIRKLAMSLRATARYRDGGSAVDLARFFADASLPLRIVMVRENNRVASVSV